MLRVSVIAVFLLVHPSTARAQIERIWLNHKSADVSGVVVNWETSAPGNSVVHHGPTSSVAHTRAREENVTLHHMDCVRP